VNSVGFEQVLIYTATSFHPSTTVNVTVICTLVGYIAIMNIVSLILFVYSWAMFYVNNPVMLEINDHALGKAI